MIEYVDGLLPPPLKNKGKPVKVFYSRLFKYFFNIIFSIIFFI